MQRELCKEAGITKLMPKQKHYLEFDGEFAAPAAGATNDHRRRIAVLPRKS